VFAGFSAKLLSIAVDNGYRLMNRDNEELSQARYWMIQRIEMTTMLNVHVVKGEGLNWNTFQALCENITRYSESILQQVGKIVNVYLIVGGEVPLFEGTEEFFGQDVSNIFWHVNATTGKVTVAPGQPKQIQGLRELIAKAFAKGEKAPQDTFIAITEARQPDSPKHHHPIITYILLAVNAVVLLFLYLEGYPADSLVPLRFGAIFPPLIHEGGEWWRLFTAMFIHFGIGHFAANAFGLFVFGTRIERYMGRVKFIVVYIFSGLLGSVFSLFLTRGYSAGASGAIYGLVGFLFIYTRIHRTSIESINWYFMLMWIAIGLAVGFSSMGTDNFGHLGGLAGGIIFGIIFALQRKKQDYI